MASVKVVQFISVNLHTLILIALTAWTSNASANVCALGDYDKNERFAFVDTSSPWDGIASNEAFKQTAQFRLACQNAYRAAKRLAETKHRPLAIQKCQSRTCSTGNCSIPLPATGGVGGMRPTPFQCEPTRPFQLTDCVLAGHWPSISTGRNWHVVYNAVFNCISACACRDGSCICPPITGELVQDNCKKQKKENTCTANSCRFAFEDGKTRSFPCLWAEWPVP